MLKSPILFNKTIATPYGSVTFDSTGKSVDLKMKEDDQKALARLPYLNFEEDKKLSPKPKPVADTEPKAEPKKTTRTRKTTKATEK